MLADGTNAANAIPLRKRACHVLEQLIDRKSARDQLLPVDELDGHFEIAAVLFNPERVHEAS
jgi:hypothetical protein